MARPTKNIDVTVGHFTKEEIEARKQAQEKIKGRADKIKPPSYLNTNQKKIFKFIVEELEITNILNNLDVFVLTQTAVIIDTLQSLIKKENEDPTVLCDRAFVSTYKDYNVLLGRYINELCLSPQARAKISNMIAQAQSQEEDPLLKALRDDDDD